MGTVVTPSRVMTNHHYPVRFSEPLLYRLYRARLSSGLVLSLPLLLGVAWFAWSAFAQLDRYRRSVKNAPPIDAELFQLALHDELTRELHRLLLPERPARSAMRTLELALPRDALDVLSSQSKEDGIAGYARGHLRSSGRMYDARVRYRGGQHWHWIGAQKSMKVRLDRGDLLDGTRVFNLLNEVTPFGLEDQLILDLAQEEGLLTPEHFPVWVRFNNSDLGVYRYEAQPEEGLLRRSRRMPGSMYSGDSEALAPSGQVGGLFWDKAGWSKVAWKDEKARDDLSELERLLHAVTAASHHEFAAYAEAEIDLERYALFDALDVVFGGNDHDYFSNHKFYLDPARGKLEPVAWMFRAFQNEPRLNLVDHPLLLRLKMTPGYLALRNRAAYALLVGKAAVPAIKARADRFFEAYAADLEADPYWDAYKLLPRVTRFHRFMVRPMSSKKWFLAAQDELHGFARRSRFLMNRLERPGLHALTYREGRHVIVDVSITGDATYELAWAAVQAPCGGGVAVRADDDLDGHLDAAKDSLVAQGPLGASLPASGRVALAAGVRLTPRADGQAKHGLVTAETEPRTYRYFVTPERCAPATVELELDNVTTGGSRRLTLEAKAALPPPPRLPVGPSIAAQVPAFAPGERSAHPWELWPSQAPRQLTLGPGRVEVAETRVFGREDTVHVAAGTDLRLGEGAALIFHGRVELAGTRGRAITIRPLTPGKAHGGVVLHGRGTAGSRLRHVLIEGGAHPRHGAAAYTGVLNLVDTKDIVAHDLVVRGLPDSGAGELLHATYVDGLRLREVHLSRAPVDALDLEFVSADVRGLTVAAAGDDCLDLMGTTLRLDDSVLIACTNNGISAGEETALAAHGILVEGSRIGVLAKNASSVNLSRSLVYHTRIALKTNRKDAHYEGRSFIGAQDLAVVESETVFDADRGTRIEPGFVQTSLGTAGLDYLREQVLRLPGWDDLPRRLTVLAGEGEAP